MHALPPSRAVWQACWGLEERCSCGSACPASNRMLASMRRASVLVSLVCVFLAFIFFGSVMMIKGDESDTFTPDVFWDESAHANRNNLTPRLRAPTFPAVHDACLCTRRHFLSYTCHLCAQMEARGAFRRGLATTAAPCTRPASPTCGSDATSLTSTTRL